VPEFEQPAKLEKTTLIRANKASIFIEFFIKTSL
jgi:hypothetical protein